MCSFGQPLILPESMNVIRLCNINQLTILENSCKDDTVAIVILYKLLYWIDHGESNVISSFKAFNARMCLTNNTKLLYIVMSFLEIYKGPSHTRTIINFLNSTLSSLFKKKETTTKPEAYYDKNKKCWVIRGVPSEELYDMGEIKLKQDAANTPVLQTSMVIKCEQQSRSYQSRYIVQPFL